MRASTISLSMRSEMRRWPRSATMCDEYMLECVDDSFLKAVLEPTRACVVRYGATLETGARCAEEEVWGRYGVSHLTPTQIIQHFFVSLFAVVHAAEYAPIAWHRAQGVHIPKGETAERCIMVMCPLGRSWYRGLWDKKREKETRNQT